MSTFLLCIQTKTMFGKDKRSALTITNKKITIPTNVFRIPYIEFNSSVILINIQKSYLSQLAKRDVSYREYMYNFIPIACCYIF